MRVRRRRFAITIAFLCAGLALAAVAKGPKPPGFEQRVERALAAWQARDFSASVAALEGALRLARDRAPLEVRKVVVVNAPHVGLGIYEPAPKGRVENRLLRLYVEVANFGTRAPHPPIAEEKGKAEDAELREVELEVMGTFFLGDGTKIGERPLGTHRFKTRTNVGVTSFGVDARLGDGAPSGPYEVELSVRDSSTEKQASRRARFVIP